MPKRTLTAGEIALAKTIFGDAIDYAAVKISDRPYVPFFQGKGMGMAPRGHIYMYGCFSKDYSKEDPYKRGHFIHEMAHVWQYQNKVLHPTGAATILMLKHKFNYMAAYHFTLDAQKDLRDYNLEQQASIIQGYFLAKNAGLTDYSRHCRNECIGEERVKLYEKVLEKFLKDPGYAKRRRFPLPWFNAPRSY